MRFDAGTPLVSARLAAIGLLLGVQVAVAQPAPAAAATEAPPAFEVASAKLSQCKNVDGAGVAHGSLTIRCYPLSRIVAWAFGVPPYAAEAAPEDRVRLMLRTLLAERFKLAVHHDTREGSQLVMTVGKNGHRLKSSESEGLMEWHHDKVPIDFLVVDHLEKVPPES